MKIFVKCLQNASSLLTVLAIPWRYIGVSHLKSLTKEIQGSDFESLPMSIVVVALELGYSAPVPSARLFSRTCILSSGVTKKVNIGA